MYDANQSAPFYPPLRTVRRRSLIRHHAPNRRSRGPAIPLRAPPALLLAILLITAALAACGGDSPNADSESSQPTTEPEATETGEFASVSTGEDHTCGVKRDGSVECWGNDEWGRATPPGGGVASVLALLIPAFAGMTM